MNIKRLNADFGNSTNNFLADSYYFEIPTCVAEVSKEQAEGLFTNNTEDLSDLLDRMLISTTINEEERYFMVGRLAENNPYANSHVGEMHDKIESHIPYAVFLAAMAYHYKNKGDKDESNAVIEIDNMKMMLPIWLLKKENKFSVGQNKMAERFLGEHNVKLLTAGMELELTIKVNESKCFIESEVGRWALKYKMVNKDEEVTSIEKRLEAKAFDDNKTVLVDVGGGSTDIVLLPEGLNTPVSKDSFQVIQITPFLGQLEVLLKEKLIEYFDDLRSLEQFIVQNYKEEKYVLKNKNLGKQYDLTEQIVEMLRGYSRLLVHKVMQPFSASKEVLKYIYFGGEAPILEPYIKEAIKELTNEEIMENHHYFLTELIEEDSAEIFKPTARTINLAALEIRSLNEMKQE